MKKLPALIAFMFFCFGCNDVKKGDEVKGTLTIWDSNGIETDGIDSVTITPLWYIDSSNKK